MRRVYTKIFLLALISLSLLAPGIHAQEKPIRVGLALSGGGAKGLAHIGILQAIDSAGLRIDAITGTSMGSIMGAMYAAGYSGDSIASLAGAIDWRELLTNKIAYLDLNPEERDEAERYLVELPFVDGKLRLGGGIIEAVPLWNKLSEVFYPVWKETKFDSLDIPFRCIAADLADGSAVVMKEGELVTALRASMAIPSVFTPVYRDGKYLVDGGIVRNFPVRDLKDMGMNYFIGSSVASDLEDPEKLTSPVDALLQISFFREAVDFKKEVAMTDIFIEHDLTKFSTASFGSGEAIIEAGQKLGRSFYPMFRQLADSIRKMTPDYTYTKNRLPLSGPVILDKIQFEGISEKTIAQARQYFGLVEGDTVTATELNKAMNRMVGSRQFEKARYSLKESGPDKALVRITASEIPRVYLKTALHYDDFTGFGLFVGSTAYRIPFAGSRLRFKMSISDDFRGLIEWRQSFGKKARTLAYLNVEHRRVDLPVYDESFREALLYRNIFTTASFRFGRFFIRNWYSGIGLNTSWIRYKPETETGVQIQGDNRITGVLAETRFNSLDDPYYPTKGIRVDAEVRYIADQRPELIITEDGAELGKLSLLEDGSENYTKINVFVNGYISLSKRITINSGFQFGYIDREERTFLDLWQVGGIYPGIYNQAYFAGLRHGQLEAQNIFIANLNVRYNINNNFMLSARANAGGFDFIQLPPESLSSRNFLSGYAGIFSYRSAIGPIDIALMYCDQSDKLITSVSIGHLF